MTDKADYYGLLGVLKTSSEDEIKAAFRSKALQLHPDKKPNDANAEQAFREITDAYEVLRDPRKRKAYDAVRDGGASSASSSYSYSRPGSTVDDNFDAWLRKWMKDHGYGAEGEEEAKRQRKWEQRSNVWAEKVASWEEQKREARLQKERDFRMRQRAANTRAARHAAVLQKFWQASPGLTWQDGVLLSLMSAFAVSSIYLLWPSLPQSQHQPADSQTADAPD